MNNTANYDTDDIQFFNTTDKCHWKRKDLTRAGFRNIWNKQKELKYFKLAPTLDLTGIFK